MGFTKKLFLTGWLVLLWSALAWSTTLRVPQDNALI